MAKLGIYSIVLALLVGLVVASGLSGHDTNNPSDDAIAGVAFRYVECAAYYQVTADVLQRDADEEFAGQYRERAGLALDAGAVLSGRSVLEMAKDRNGLANRLAAELATSGQDLGHLASRYDDQCVALLDG